MTVQTGQQADATTALRDCVRSIFAENRVAAVLGYARGRTGARPIVIRKAEETDLLVFDATCFHNLANWLARKELANERPLGVVLKGCDARALPILEREHQIDRNEIVAIGVRCAGVGEPRLSKCERCDVHEPKFCDVVIGGEVPSAETTERRFPELSQFETMSREERWAFWMEQFSRCIRCYACRQVCPMCTCETCIADRNLPQWIDVAPHLRGNVAWNIVRALHLAGRCIDCGECERACPAGIPLTALNSAIARELEVRYGYVAGRDPEEPLLLTSFKPDDPEGNFA